MTELLYGSERGRATDARIERLIERWRGRIPARPAGGFTERDAVLITYGDMVREPGVPPLATLARFCAKRLAGAFTFVHVLPFYPSSSDEGFSVTDYRAVDPALGTWDDLERLGSAFGLMLDAVFNHVSARSAWFRRFLDDDPRYRSWFITVPEGTDLSGVTRPRTLPLLTKFATAAGERLVWTTFSEDQVDLNYAEPEVLLETIDTLLSYASRGAGLIRLDAIAYLWKRIGTPCIHLPETHRIIQIYRAVLDRVAPHVALITETNVAHAENVSYFGDGANEAQMVYNFALPPLALHSFHTASAAALSRWAATLAVPSPRTTFFNFLASHDGIGLNAARGILADAEVTALVNRARAHGGLVSHRTNSDGSESPYELNINYCDALTDPSEPVEAAVARLAGAHAIALALPGVPGIWFHSMFGSTGWREGAELTGSRRAVNRQRLELAALEAELADESTRRARVFARMKRLLEVRAAHPAFAPAAAHRVVDAGDPVFALLRTAPGGEEVLCLQNVSGEEVAIDLERVWGARGAVELIGGGRAPRRLGPWQTAWLGGAS
jgi:glycosidase